MALTGRLAGQPSIVSPPDWTPITSIAGQAKAPYPDMNLCTRPLVSPYIWNFQLSSIIDFLIYHIVIGIGSWFDFSFLKFAKIVCGMSYDLFWWMFHVHLKRVYFGAGGRYVQMHFWSIWSEVCFYSNISVLDFCLDNLSIIENVILRYDILNTSKTCFSKILHFMYLTGTLYLNYFLNR